MYIADANNYRIRKVMVSTGIITTIAGTGTGGYSGDNGPATSAAFGSPEGVAVDSSGSTIIIICFATCFNIFCEVILLLSTMIHILPCSIGNVYVADFVNNRIRKITISTGIITTIAGTGSTVYSGDYGAATSATLYYPSAVAVDSSGMDTACTLAAP